jgi:site-specific recombinase XerD
MLRIRFYQILSKRNQGGEAPIYMRINGLDKEVNLSTHIYQHPRNWDKRKSRFKTSIPNANYLNSLIKNKEEEVWKFVNECKIHGKNLSSGSVKNFFKNDEYETFQRTILNGFDQLISLNKLTYARGTLRHYKADKQILKNFIRYKYHQDDCILTEINFEFLTSFQSYLIEVRKNKPNTIGKHVQRIRSVINFVIKLDWIAEDPTKNFKVKTDPTSRITLNIGEISALASLELNSNPNLEITRDLFLFMTHTGLSYSDLKALSWNHIDNGLTLIRMSRKKSKEYCVIPLIPQAQSIMNKYKNHPVAEYNSKCFPVFSNQVLNRRLKELGTIAKIDKPITCHIARHSFACISLDNKVPLESISRVLGHTSLKTTQIYAKISASKIEADFQVLTKIFG